MLSCILFWFQGVRVLSSYVNAAKINQLASKSIISKMEMLQQKE